MATEKELSDFLMKNENNAFRRALYAIKNEESALDIVQDSMLKLVENYSSKPVNELLFLFQRIITNNIIDWFRIQNTHGNIIKSINDFNIDEDSEDNFLESLESLSPSETPFDIKNRHEVLSIIEEAIQTLPYRQRDAFVLRHIQDLSIQETALIMNCSDGSIKTHCSRAVATLSRYLISKGVHLHD